MNDELMYILVNLTDRTKSALRDSLCVKMNHDFLDSKDGILCHDVNCWNCPISTRADKEDTLPTNLIKVWEDIG